MLREISQTEKDKYCMLSIMHEQQKIQQTNEHNRKEAETSGYQWVGKGTIGIGKCGYKLLGLSQATKMYLLYREYSQHFVITNWSITLNL